MPKIEIEFLDHVAIRVSDMEASAQWYEKVLGLKRYQLAAWGGCPILLLARKTGIALFPADHRDTKPPKESKTTGIDHFAFNVTRENLANAKGRYEQLGLDYTIQDHHYFDSIYTTDPDGHIVELTAIKGKAQDFYV